MSKFPQAKRFKFVGIRMSGNTKHFEDLVHCVSLKLAHKTPLRVLPDQTDVSALATKELRLNISELSVSNSLKYPLFCIFRHSFK